MKITLSTFLLLFFMPTAHTQAILGKWKTGNEKAVVEIYKDNGSIYGKVHRILIDGQEDKTCEKCKGETKNKPIKGMVILKGLEKDGPRWKNGTLLHPETGKTYKLKVTPKEKDILKVRGYKGFSLFGRTQYWHRMPD